MKYSLRTTSGRIEINTQDTPKQIAKKIRKGTVEMFDGARIINWSLVEYAELIPGTRPEPIKPIPVAQPTPQPQPIIPAHEQVKAHLEAKAIAEAVETPEKIDHTITVEDEEIAPVYVSEKSKK